EWRNAGKRGGDLRTAWEKRVAMMVPPKKGEFERLMKNKLPTGLDMAIQAFKKKLTEEKPNWATRKSSGEVLAVLTDIIPELIGGSADLTGSNLTKTKQQDPITRDDFSGSYIYYGIREHAMAAAMNGLALY